MIAQELADALLLKYANSTNKPAVTIRPMARNRHEVQMLLEGTLSEGGLPSSVAKQSPKLIEAKEASEYLGISRSALRYHADIGRIERDGGLFLLTSIEEFKKIRSSKAYADRGFKLNNEQIQQIKNIIENPKFSYSKKNSKTLGCMAIEYGVSISTLDRAIKKSGHASSVSKDEWQDDEIALLRELSAKYSPAAVIKKMAEQGCKRSNYAIYKKISKLRLKENPVLSEKFSINKLVGLLKVSRRSVYAEAKKFAKNDGGYFYIDRKDAIKIANLIPNSDLSWIVA